MTEVRDHKQEAQGLLVSLGMDLGHSTRDEETEDQDADLRRLLQIIVRDYDGDTSAYFDSLRNKESAGSSQEESQQERESRRLARRFVKTSVICA